MSMVFAAIAPQIHSLSVQLQCEGIIEMLDWCNQRAQLNHRLTGRKDEWHLFPVSCLVAVLFYFVVCFKVLFQNLCF